MPNFNNIVKDDFMSFRTNYIIRAVPRYALANLDSYKEYSFWKDNTITSNPLEANVFVSKEQAMRKITQLIRLQLRFYYFVEPITIGESHGPSNI
jgi:hypothetical protein